MDSQVTPANTNSWRGRCSPHDPLTAATHPAYLQIRDLIYRTAGIYYSADKIYLMADRCQRRMKALGCGSPEQYLESLSSESEMRSLLNEITVGETYMFRNSFQLAALQDVIIPQITSEPSPARGKHLRIWSAGCSTGEEPYTLAMVLLELPPNRLQGRSLEVLATDINDNSLETARSGIYGEYALRNTTPYYRSKYFTRYDQDRLQVTPALKSAVQFNRLNLNDGDRMQLVNPVDVIFCCNVLIYFDLASKTRAVQNLCSRLNPGGYLFLGHAESLFQVETPLHLIHFPRTTAYRKPQRSLNGGDR